MANTRSMKSARSVRSIRSIRSINNMSGTEKAFREEKKGDGDLHSFDNMLIMASQRLQCPFEVTVTKETKPDYCKNLKQASLYVKSKRISLMPQAKLALEVESRKSKSSSRTAVLTSTECTISSGRLHNITVTMVYDSYNTLTEILITKVKDVPRSLLRMICLLLPYYRNVTRITISKCEINMYTIYELSKILNASTITEICLDGSLVSGADYELLLDTTKLRFLSLCRCNVQDDTCKLIGVKLQCKASAENLLLLNLSSNRITDEGAKYIGNALRTNRHLRYLNLADNHITDCGAGQILDVLMEFPLTCDEIMNMRRRRLDYFKRKNNLFEKYLASFHKRSFDDLSRKSPKKRKTSLTTLRKVSPRRDKELVGDDDYVKTKAEMLTVEALGPFEDPFHPKTVKRIEGYIYSIGNMTLAYLNFAFNNLSYISIRKLQNVLKNQNINTRIRGGLVKVVLQGNNLPITCPELNVIADLMAKTRGKISEILVKPKRVEK